MVLNLLNMPLLSSKHLGLREAAIIGVPDPVWVKRLGPLWFWRKGAQLTINHKR
jgi:hypothetical protein